MRSLLKNIPIVGTFLKKLKYNFIIIKNYFRIKFYIIRQNHLKIVIGSSSVFENGWCPTDIQNLNLLQKKSFIHLFKERRVDVFLAEHVWEHLTIAEARIAAKNCYDYLKRDGYMRIAVPDGFHQDKSYIDAVDVDGTGVGSDDHKVLYNYKTLSDIFVSAGFKVELLEYFDENHTFHCNHWDKKQGMIHRSKRYDERNIEKQLVYTSIIIDVYKE